MVSGETGECQGVLGTIGETGQKEKQNNRSPDQSDWRKRRPLVQAMAMDDMKSRKHEPARGVIEDTGDKEPSQGQRRKQSKIKTGQG